MRTRDRLNAKAVSRRVVAQDRQRRVLQLLIEGHTLDEAAAEVGYAGKQGAAKARDAALAARDARVDSAVDAYRSQAEERLATVLDAIWEMCKEGDLDAIDRYVKVEARWSKMRGGDAPQKIEATTTVTDATPAAARAAIRALFGDAVAVEEPAVTHEPSPSPEPTGDAPTE